MFRKALRALAAFAILILLIAPLTVSAHETITAGKYAIEYGWLNEPPVVGQPNAIVINIGAAEESSSTDTSLDVDVSNFKIEMSYGGEKKTLALQPLGENTPGQFIAPLTPTRAGQFTMKLSGKLNSEALGETEVSTEVQPEEVLTADIVQFPSAAAEAQSSPTRPALIVGIIGIVLGLIGTGLGVYAVMKK